METVLSVLHAQTKRGQDPHTKNSHWDKAVKTSKSSEDGSAVEGQSDFQSAGQQEAFRGKTSHRSLSELPPDLRNIIRLSRELQKLDAENAYIPASAYGKLIGARRRDLRDLEVLHKKGMLALYCRQCGIRSARFVEQVEQVLDLCADTPEAEGAIKEHVRDHNERWMERALEEEKAYLDHVLDPVDPQIRLDDAQRRMVLTDEDNCLVIAGAGAGKTTSVAAKVRYLVDRKGIKPEEILVISFTNKAVEELRGRIQRDLGIPCPICTFHSAGNAVLHMQDPERINIVDGSKKFFVIREYFRTKILQDERLVHSLILFFASYFDAPLNENDLEAFFRGIAQMRYTTMRSELDEYCAEIMDNQRKKKVTIRNEILRSSQEVEIANFLYRNGIDYVYEPVYRYHIELARKPYTPDFLIRQGDREIYIEHFGITRDGRNSRYDAKRLQAYKDAVNEKVLLHRRHGTELIYTFSGYGDGRSLTDHLEEELRAHGVVLNPRPDREILQKILQNEGNRYIRRLVELICRFITNFKTDGFTEMQFGIMKESTDNVRTKLFLEICQACYLEYQKVLRELKAVDFEDMINDSARALRECAEMKQRLNFKYIIVDEYQDISRQRFDLTKALRQVCDAKVIAVGDDWQSIYAFSGSDITLFTQFQEKMGPAAMLRIENTYRNAQELIDIAGSFVQKNPAQITKTLHSEKRVVDPVIIYSYDASYKRYGMDRNAGANYNMGKAIEAALDHIVASRERQVVPDQSAVAEERQAVPDFGSAEVNRQAVPDYGSAETGRQAGRNQTAVKKKAGKPIHVLVLGRYNFDGYKLEQTELFTYRGKGKGRQIISRKYPEIRITFLTAHASKGLGYDEVIVINGQGGTYGFPSKIEDDPVLSLVLREDRSYTYAEERRLFYVAMTRTKNRVYFIAPQQEPSEFLLELLRDYKNVRLDAFAEEMPSADNTGRNTDGIAAGEEAKRLASAEASERSGAEKAAGEGAKGLAGKESAEKTVERILTGSGRQLQAEEQGRQEEARVRQEEERKKDRFLHQSATGFAMDRKKCPLCGYPLQLRYKAAYGLRLYMCTNDAEICGFMTNDLRGGRMSILKCDMCTDGYLIVRIRRKTGEAFLGCTNYSRDRRGCGRTMGWPEYQQKMRYEPGYRS